MTNRKPLQRRIIAGTASFALAVGVGVAVAGIFGRADITGKAEAGKFAASWYSTSSQDSNGTLSSTDPGADVVDPATNSKVSGSSAQVLNFTSPVPGQASAYRAVDFGNGVAVTLFPGEEALRIRAQVALTDVSARSGYVSGVTGNLPSGWTARLVSGCGLGVKKGETSKNYLPFVEVVLAPTSEAAAPLDGATAALAVQVTPTATAVSISGQAVPGAPTTCPVLTGAAG